jgi:hypothetical protein
MDGCIMRYKITDAGIGTLYASCIASREKRFKKNLAEKLRSLETYHSVTYNQNHAVGSLDC